MAAREIGDDAVKRATGRGWEEWLKLLDKAVQHSKLRSQKDVAKRKDYWREMLARIG